MKCYAIVKVGNDYVVQVNNRGVMKFTSKRKAIRSVAVAAGLLEQAWAAEVGEARSLPCGSCQVP